MSKELKKVLILAYFFKPNSLTASNRPFFWIKYLHKFGYYPVVVTRTWGDGKISSPKDVFSKGSNEVNRIEKFDNYEVHYVSYKPNVRDRLFVDDKNAILVKILTLLALLTKGISNYFNEGKEIYNHAREIVKKECIQKLIITANPFVMFKYGYLLSQEFGLKWIADYRDDWTTSELIDNNGAIFSLVNRLDKRLERRWVRSASVLTSVSAYYVKKITEFVGIAGKELLNGFEEFNELDVQPSTENFQMCYNGTLYQTQKVETLLNGIKLFIDKNSPKDFKMCFPGISFSKEQEKRVLDLVKGYESYFYLSNRITKSKVLQMQLESHCLVMVNHQGLKGIPSSKLYEYLSLKRPILVVNGDDDIVDFTVKKAGVGIVCNSDKEIAEYIERNYKLFKNKDWKGIDKDNDSSLFKVENQIKNLAQLLNDL